MSELKVDVRLRRKDLVTVVAVVIFGWLVIFQGHVEPRQQTNDEPFQLKKSETLAGAEGSESKNGVLQLFAVLVEGGIDKSIMLESLKRTTKSIKKLFMVHQ